MDIDAQWLKTREITQGCVFLVSDRWLTTFRGSNFPKPRCKICYSLLQNDFQKCIPGIMAIYVW